MNGLEKKITMSQATREENQQPTESQMQQKKKLMKCCRTGSVLAAIEIKLSRDVARVSPSRFH